MRTLQEIVSEALTLHQQGRRAEALRIYDKMLGMMDEPQPTILMGYGLMLAQDDYHGLAKHLMVQAIEKGEPYAPLWYNLGVSLTRLDRDEAAKSAFEEALKIDPEFSDAMSGMAGRHINTGSPKEAETWARKALELSPESPDAHNNLALALMEQERFEEAWPHWEYRWKLQQNIKNVRDYGCPRWDGSKVDTLVIHGEQGLGDEILYMSVLYKVRPFAKRIIIECATRLVKIFEESFNLECHATAEEVKRHHSHIDAYIPMGSLFSIVGFPEGKPFLKTTPKPKSRKPLVGIAWKGGLQRTHKKFRTMKLEQLKPILETRGLQFVNLQYGGPEIVGEANETNLFTPDDRSFQELVHWIAACDLVITPCQTNVHVAGALGKDCWVMTPQACAWRYAGVSDTMRYYRSVRLYRQDEPGEWGPVIERIAADLRERYV